MVGWMDGWMDGWLGGPSLYRKSNLRPLARTCIEVDKDIRENCYSQTLTSVDSRLTNVRLEMATDELSCVRLNTDKDVP